MKVSRLNTVFAYFKSSNKTGMKCYPLDWILASIQVSHVDYFSLDIEGLEIDVLKSFPFDRFNIIVQFIEIFIYLYHISFLISVINYRT